MGEWVGDWIPLRLLLLQEHHLKQFTTHLIADNQSIWLLMNDDVLSWIFDHSWGTGTPPQSRNWGQQVGVELVFSSTQPLIVLIRPPSAFNSIQETHLFSSHSLSTLRCILNQNLDSILAFQTLLHIFNIVLLFLTWITKDVNNISQAFYNDLLLEPATWGKENWNKHFQAFLVLFVLFWVG